MMRRIAGKRLLLRDLPNYTWNADLVAFDGPLLSLYKSDEGGDALFIWLDSDDEGHRWAVTDISRDRLMNYLQGSASLRKLIQTSRGLFVFDVVNDKRRNLVWTTWERLPEEYLPDEASFLTREIATLEALQLAEETSAEYSIELDGELYIDDLASIPRLYQQLYSFHYGLQHFDRTAVRQTITSTAKRWTGGFSAVNLFTGLAAVMPSIHRPRIRELRYSSPGRIKLELLPHIAAEIREAAHRLGRDNNLDSAERLNSDIGSYLRSQKISGFEDDAGSKEDRLTPEQVSALRSYVREVLGLLGWEDYEARFVEYQFGPLTQLRAVLAYYRRLRRLVVYEQSGSITLT